MPKLYSAREVIKSLEKAGFVEVSQRGSHLKMRGFRGGTLRTAIVPMHKQIVFGTFRSILRQAGMTLSEFEKFL